MRLPKLLMMELYFKRDLGFTKINFITDENIIIFSFLKANYIQKLIKKLYMVKSSLHFKKPSTLT